MAASLNINKILIIQETFSGHVTYNGNDNVRGIVKDVI
jgi:hypothetical protein